MSNMTQEFVSTISDIFSRDSPPPKKKRRSVQNLAFGNNMNNEHIHAMNIDQPFF